MTSGALCLLTAIPQDLSFPLEFGIPTSGPNAARNSWIVGVVNAAPYLGSAAWYVSVLGDLASYNIRAPLCSGCWISDPLNNYLGRRGTIFVTALILIATPIASGFTHSWQTLFVVRLILGIGMGVKGRHVNVLHQENQK
jgi:MFS family permease